LTPLFGGAVFLCLDFPADVVGAHQRGEPQPAVEHDLAEHERKDCDRRRGGKVAQNAFSDGHTAILTPGCQNANPDEVALLIGVVVQQCQAREDELLGREGEVTDVDAIAGDRGGMGELVEVGNQQDTSLRFDPKSSRRDVSLITSTMELDWSARRTTIRPPSGADANFRS
jgi:hypothetical protein